MVFIICSSFIIRMSTTKVHPLSVIKNTYSDPLIPPSATKSTLRGIFFRAITRGIRNFFGARICSNIFTKIAQWTCRQCDINELSVPCLILNSECSHYQGYSIQSRDRVAVSYTRRYWNSITIANKRGNARYCFSCSAKSRIFRIRSIYSKARH